MKYLNLYNLVLLLGVFCFQGDWAVAFPLYEGNCSSHYSSLGGATAEYVTQVDVDHSEVSGTRTINDASHPTPNLINLADPRDLQILAESLGGTVSTENQIQVVTNPSWGDETDGVSPVDRAAVARDMIQTLIEQNSSSRLSSSGEEKTDPLLFYQVDSQVGEGDMGAVYSPIGKGGMGAVYRGKMPETPHTLSGYAQFPPGTAVVIKVPHLPEDRLNAIWENEMANMVQPHDTRDLFLASGLDTENNVLVMEDLSKDYMSLREYMSQHIYREIRVPDEIAGLFHQHKDSPENLLELGYLNNLMGIGSDQKIRSIHFEPRTQELTLKGIQISPQIREKIGEQVYGTNGVLQTLQASGVSHRDIKPENIMINPETGQIKVIDFGLSTPYGQANPFLSQVDYNSEQRVVMLSPKISGTRAYMHPEALEGKPAHPKYDRHSFDVTFERIDSIQIDATQIDATQIDTISQIQ